MGRGLVFAIALFGLMAVAVGCGKSDAGSTAASAPPLSKPKFVAAANRICVGGWLRSQKEARASYAEKARLSPKHTGAVRRQVRSTVLAPSLRARLERVAKLGIPAGDEERVREILATIDAVAHHAEEDPYGFKDVKDPFRQARRLARAYGIGPCARMFVPGV
jgi:hypothetical protein